MKKTLMITGANVEIEPYLEELKVAIKNPMTPEIKEIMKRFIISYREPAHHG